MPRPSATFERVESTQNQRRSRYQHAPLVWLSRTFGGAQSRRDEAQRLGSAAPLSIFRAAPIAKWQQAAGLPKNAFTSNGITALGLLPFHKKCGRAALLVELKAADEAQRLGSAAPFNFSRRPDREVAASGRLAQKCVHFQRDHSSRTASFPPKVRESHCRGGTRPGRCGRCRRARVGP